jgi:hypothetical protein
MALDPNGISLAVQVALETNMPDITSAVLFWTELDNAGRFAIVLVEQQQTDPCGMPAEDREMKCAAGLMHAEPQGMACFNLNRAYGLVHRRLPALHGNLLSAMRALAACSQQASLVRMG